MDEPSVNEKDGIKAYINSHMQILSAKTGIPAPIILGVLVFCCICVFIGYFDKYITILVAVIYPSYWSIKAIESEEKGDDTQWLTYWVVFAFFTVFDTVGGAILQYIPFYFFIKIVFLIWCFLPNTRGATVIYNKILRGCFKKYETRLDELNNDIENKFGDVYGSGVNYMETNKVRIIKTGLDASMKYSNN